MRLTKKKEDDGYVIQHDLSTYYMCHFHPKDVFDVFAKLGQLEDIEEELGINLITFLKAILQIFVWVKYKNKIVQAGLCLNQNDSGYYFWVDDKPYFIKDYGKTWALTREELL